MIAGPELVLLNRKRQRVQERVLVRARPADRRQPTDRLGIVHQLLDRHVIAPLEEPPPRRPRLAPVVFQQLAREPARRAGLAAADQHLPQRLALPRRGVVGLRRLGNPRPRRAVGPVRDEPVAQRQRRAAVVVVVRRYAVQQHAVARVHVPLVRQHRVRPGAHIGLARKAGQRLDLLQRVARDTGPKPLAHHRVEVHEDLAPQQVVHLVLARRIDTHQLGDCRLLVRAVVVHVHARIAREPPVHQVDEVLEEPPLAGAIVGPPRLVAPVRAVAQQQAEEKVQPARRLPERIALDVEEEVTRRRRRQGLEAAAGLGVDRMPVEAPRHAVHVLQVRLIAQPVERVLLDVGDRGR